MPTQSGEEEIPAIASAPNVALRCLLPSAVRYLGDFFPSPLSPPTPTTINPTLWAKDAHPSAPCVITVGEVAAVAFASYKKVNFCSPRILFHNVYHDRYSSPIEEGPLAFIK